MKKTLSLLVVLCLFMTLLPGIGAINAFAFSGSGSGTEQDPYVITNAEQFKEIANDLKAHYKLEANEEIVLDNSFTCLTPYTGNATRPNFSSSFTGSLVGVTGKNVIRLDIDRTGTDEVATVFGQLWNNAKLENLVIKGSITGGNYPCTSALVGKIYKGSTVTIKDITNEADVVINQDANYSYSGGIIGFVETSNGNNLIENCVNKGNVTFNGTDNGHFGGIVGFIGRSADETLTLKNCRNYGKISGGKRLGGVVGVSQGVNLILENCANLGDVTGTASANYCGGLMGGIDGATAQEKTVIKNCFNTGKISGLWAGGFMSSMHVTAAGASLSFENCFNAGELAGSNLSVGFGYDLGSNNVVSFKNCYNVGEILSGNTQNAIYARGTPASISGVYYLSGTNGQGTALTVSQLQGSLPEGFDPEVWIYTSTEDGNFYPYPQLKDNIYVDENAPEGWNEELNGNGTADFPYQISSKDQLAYVAQHPNASFKLITDITDPVTEPIAETFSGSFEGDGHSIALNIASEGSYTGLFSKIVGGSVSNLTVTGTVSGGWTEGVLDTSNNPVSGTGGIAGGSKQATFINCVNRANITSSTGNAVAGIVGDAYYVDGGSVSNTFQNCVNYGDVTSAGGYTAGIVGVAASTPITYCGNYGDITGAGSGVGGITGMVYYRIHNCFNAGNIQAASYAGGIGGQLRATYPLNDTKGISNCYNIGTITVTRSNGVASGFGSCSHTSHPLAFTNCYNAGVIVSSDGTQKLSDASLGVTYTNCYALTADAAADGLDGIAGVTAVTPDTLKTAALGDAFTVDAEGVYKYPQLVSNPQAEAFEFALLTVTVGENGSASLSGKHYVKDGAQFPITFTPAENYVIDTIKINNMDQVVTESISPVISGDTTIAVTFKEKTASAPEFTFSKAFLPDAKDSSITFGTVTGGYGYEVVSYGILYADTEEALRDTPAECTMLEAEVAKNDKGQYGIELLGLIPDSGYYTMPYVVYKAEGTEELFVAYGEIVEVK